MVLLRHKGKNKRPQRRKSRERRNGITARKKKRGFNILVISETEKNIPLERNGRTAKIRNCAIYNLTLKDHWEKNYSKKHPKTAKRKISTNKFELIVQ